MRASRPPRDAFLITLDRIELRLRALESGLRRIQGGGATFGAQIFANSGAHMGASVAVAPDAYVTIPFSNAMTISETSGGPDLVWEAPGVLRVVVPGLYTLGVSLTSESIITAGYCEARLCARQGATPTKDDYFAVQSQATPNPGKFVILNPSGSILAPAGMKLSVIANLAAAGGAISFTVLRATVARV